MGAKRWIMIVVAALANLVIIGLVLSALEEDPWEPPDPPYYVSVGDSYAQGFQANGDLSRGFADQVVDLLGDEGQDLGLVNFGCGGATTSSMTDLPGCVFPASGTPSYPAVSQVAAAEEFLRAHAGQVELITISIGGNDVSLCTGTADPVACSDQVIVDIGPKLTDIVARLRAAAGPDVPVVGITYPNTILGRWVRPPVDENMARLSAEVYRQIFNPVLRTAYETAGAVFVDVTEATGGYGPLDAMTTLDPYGEIPESVAAVCTLTRYCELGDVHPTTEGYALIARLVVDALGARDP